MVAAPKFRRSLFLLLILGPLELMGGERLGLKKLRMHYIMGTDFKLSNAIYFRTEGVCKNTKHTTPSAGRRGIALTRLNLLPFSVTS